jgi:hypothetical protein
VEDTDAQQVEADTAEHLPFQHSILLTVPSTLPELWDRVRPAWTAFRLRRRLRANEATGVRVSVHDVADPLLEVLAGQLVIMVANRRTWRVGRSRSPSGSPSCFRTRREWSASAGSNRSVRVRSSG